MGLCRKSYQNRYINENFGFSHHPRADPHIANSSGYFKKCSKYMRLYSEKSLNGTKKTNNQNSYIELSSLTAKASKDINDKKIQNQIRKQKQIFFNQE